MKVGVIGEGIAGLGAVHELGKRRHEVAVFEREADLGRQAATFRAVGERVERFYHHIFASDVVCYAETPGIARGGATVLNKLVGVYNP